MLFNFRDGQGWWELYCRYTTLIYCFSKVPQDKVRALKGAFCCYLWKDISPHLYKLALSFTHSPSFWVLTKPHKKWLKLADKWHVQWGMLWNSVFVTKYLYQMTSIMHLRTELRTTFYTLPDVVILLSAAWHTSKYAFGDMLQEKIKFKYAF